MIVERSVRMENLKIQDDSQDDPNEFPVVHGSNH